MGGGGGVSSLACVVGFMLFAGWLCRDSTLPFPFPFLLSRGCGKRVYELVWHRQG